MRPWLLLLWILGLVAAAAAGWFLAKRPVVENGDLRLFLPLVPVIVWALVPVLFSRVLFRRAAPGETPALRELRREVTAFLADRGLRGARGRYSVPFFLVVGPPGSGKTGLLERSDMRLGMPKAIGPATWWVGPDAVFIEAQTSDDAGDLFRLLRAVRPKLAVNGVLLVVSPADLVLADQLEQRMVAQTIAGWFRQADDVLQQTLPTYFLLSRTDLVPGFQEIFERIEPADRAQPWGFALSGDRAGSGDTGEDLHADIDRGFGDIVETMRRRHIEFLSRESDAVRCGHIYGFAAQIAAIQRIVLPIIEAVTPLGTGAWKGALLRGIFMTSARQEMLSIDALLPELSRRFAMPRSGMLPPDLGADDELELGYFISGAVKKAILPEAGLVLRERQRRSSAVVYWLPLVIALAACLGGGYFLFSAFDREIRMSAEVQEAIGEAAPLANPAKRTDVPAALAALERLEGVETVLAGETVGLRRAFWFDNRRMLRERLADAKRSLRVNALVPELAAWLEADLVDGGNDNAALNRLIMLAGAGVAADEALLREWLRMRAPEIAPSSGDDFVDLALGAIREAGGLEVGAAYIEAARRRVAYRDSLT